MTEHLTKFAPELNDGQGADVDVEILPLVRMINVLGRSQDVQTVSSCQGDKGRGFDGYISFQGRDYITTAKFVFEILPKAFRGLTGFLVHLDVSCYLEHVDEYGPCGSINFGNKNIAKIKKVLSHTSMFRLAKGRSVRRKTR